MVDAAVALRRGLSSSLPPVAVVWLALISMAAAASPSEPKLRRYLLIRHGETDFNRDQRQQGSSDVSKLTPEGRLQAGRLGDYIARRQMGDAADAIAIRRAWCSPLTRCKDTLSVIQEQCLQLGHQLIPEPIICADLREIELKEWEGRLTSDIQKDDGENWELFKTDPTKLRLDGGSFAPVLDCWERGRKNWEAIRSKAAAVEGSAEGATLIVAHGQMGQCMLLCALGLGVVTYGRTPKFIFDNCGCVELEWVDGEECCRRWRWVHPAETDWELAYDTRRMVEGEHSVARLGEEVSHM